MSRTVPVLNGLHLNMPGTRESAIHGYESLADVSVLRARIAEAHDLHLLNKKG